MNTINIICKLNEDDLFSISSEAMLVNLINKENIHYTFWNTNASHNPFLKNVPIFFSKEGLDLLYLSLFVFYADRRLKREMFPDAWTRNIKLYVPVLSIDMWNSQIKLLEEMLSFLSGDIWSIEFRQRKLNEIEKSFITKQNSGAEIKLDSAIFCMLSGGLDSFIGAIDLLEQNDKIVFINHYGGGPSGSNYINSVQNALDKEYRGKKSFNIFKFHAAVIDGVEDTTRTRSFMFFSHAIVLATAMNKNADLLIPENGLISLNIPLTNSRLGSSSTRTTHPYYMKLLQNLLDNLGILVTLKNPYQFKTKGEMILDCKNQQLLKDNIDNTMSRSHPDVGRYQKETHPSHCGICLPCLIRRASIEKGNIMDRSVYRDFNFSSGVTAKNNLSAYKIGLLKYKKSVVNRYFQIQISGQLESNLEDYKNLYERGMMEIENYLGKLNV